MDFLLPIAFGAAGSLWSQNYNSGEASKERDFNAVEAEKNRRFQERMIGTQMSFQERMAGSAHQREVADLRAAGLNPMLSAMHGGAASPAGSAGSGSAASTGTGARTENPLSGVANYALNARRLDEIDKMRVANETAATNADVAFKQAQAQAAQAQAELTRSQIPKVEAETVTESGRPEFMRSQMSKMEQEIEESRARTKLDLARAPLAEIEADFWRHMAPIAADVVRSIAGVGSRIVNLSSGDVLDAIKKKLTSQASAEAVARFSAWVESVKKDAPQRLSEIGESLKTYGMKVLRGVFPVHSPGEAGR